MKRLILPSTTARVSDEPVATARSMPLALAIGALCVALAYIVRLRRELDVARQRGDRYRDLTASLDREHAQAPSAVETIR